MSVPNAVLVSIPSVDGNSLKKRSDRFSLLKKKGTYDPKQFIHSIKVGLALVVVSQLYFVDPLYDQAGENSMWAILTVVVIFEYFAGATLSKGLNRGMGTVLGGGLGCLAAILAEEVGGVGKAIAIGLSVFISGAVASYSRLVPSVKAKYDYGALIFLLTFNLVVVSGLRGEQVIQLARERLATIVMGFVVCMLTNLLIFPVWAGDELHFAIVAKFDNLATSIEGCLEEYFNANDEKKEKQVLTDSNGYKAVLQSKYRDDTLANFAKWEPWHGKFGFRHPWDKYLYIGELLRELAASIYSLKGCLQSSRKMSTITIRLYVKEECEAVASWLAYTLRELGSNTMEMRKSTAGTLNISKLQLMRRELTEAMSALQTLTSSDELATASFVFLLMEMINQVEKLVKEVQDLGDLAGFIPQ